MTIIPRSAQSDPEFAALAERYRQMEAVARQMLEALKQDTLQFDTLCRVGKLTEQEAEDCARFARAAIAAAEAAGIGKE